MIKFYKFAYRMELGVKWWWIMIIISHYFIFKFGLDVVLLFVYWKIAVIIPSFGNAVPYFKKLDSSMILII